MKNILNIFAKRSAITSVMANANRRLGLSFPVDYYTLHVEDRRNIVARFAAGATKGNPAQTTAALQTLKVVLESDSDPLVRWNVVLAAIETVREFPELGRTAFNMLDMIVRKPVPGEEPELNALINKARETAPVPPAPKAL
ncbi:MAG TPA: hypothetical protein VIG74_03350 [Alphaproteobacteria bacterium]